MLKNIKTITILSVAIFTFLIGSNVAFADTNDTISINGSIVTSTCNTDIYVDGQGTILQYWSVSTATGNGSLATPCGQTIDVTGFDYGTLTAHYYASGQNYWGDISTGGTVEYVQPTNTTGGIQIATDGVMAGVATSASGTFTSLLPILVALAGLFLAFFVVQQVIGLIPKSKSSKK